MRRKVPCKVFTKVVGYARPKDRWNKGKQQEWADRTMVNLGGSAG